MSWFCQKLMGMPERLSLPIVWSEDPSEATAVLNTQRE